MYVAEFAGMLLSVLRTTDRAELSLSIWKQHEDTFDQSDENMGALSVSAHVCLHDRCGSNADLYL